MGIKLICDEMLGSLSRWLRLAGLDVIYSRDRTDAEIVLLAEEEGRLFITRDVQLASRIGELSCLIRSRDLDEQIEEVKGMGFSERFIRMWEYYLCYCEGAFQERYIGDVQMLLTKPRCRRDSLLPELAVN